MRARRWPRPPARAQSCSPDYSGVTLTVGTQTGPYIASALHRGRGRVEEEDLRHGQRGRVPLVGALPEDRDHAGRRRGHLRRASPSRPPGRRTSRRSCRDAGRDAAGPGLGGHPPGLPRAADGLGRQGARPRPWTATSTPPPTASTCSRTRRSRRRSRRSTATTWRRPKTWKEYLDIAEFFTRPDQSLWGTAEAFRRGGQQFWFFFSHAAAYTNHPDHPGSMFFDPETMDAQVNNPGWVRGLEEYIKASKLAPPNALNFSFGEVNAAMAGGQVAESIGWGDTGVIARRSEAVARSRQGRLVVAARARRGLELQDQAMGQVRPAGRRLAVHGLRRLAERRAAGVARTRRRPGTIVAAPDQPGGLGQGRDHRRLGRQPLPAQPRQEPRPVDRTCSASARRRSISAPSWPRIERQERGARHAPAGYFSYTEVLEIELSKALAGEVTPQQALDTVAAEWNRLTDEFGRDEQLAAYRASMGLPRQVTATRRRIRSASGRGNLVRAADGDRRAVSKRSAMSGSASAQVTKSFGDVPVIPPLDLDDRRQGVRRPGGPVGLRQDHDLADDRRVGDADVPARSASASGTSPACAPACAIARWCSRITRSIRT